MKNYKKFFGVVTVFLLIASFSIINKAEAASPVISGVATNTGTSTANISFTTDIVATSTINYGLTSSYGTASSTNVLATSTTFRLTGLTASSTYHYMISVWSSTSSLATTSDATFTTLSNASSSPTVTTSAASSVSTSTAVLNGAIVSNNNSTSTVRGFNYGTSTAYSATTTNTSTFSAGSFSTTTLNLLPGTTYHYRAYAINTAGSGYGTDQTFMTLPLAPVISSISSGTPGQNTATITFNTDISATSTLLYGINASYGNIATTTPSSTSFSFVLLGLSAGTTYDFQIVSVNSAGLTSTSSDQTFVTAAAATSSSSTHHGSSHRSSASNGSSASTQTTVSTSVTPSTVPTTVTNTTTTSIITPSTTGVLPTSSMSRNLMVGAVGNDVMMLQKYLNAHGFVVSTSGPGSVGQETMTFGSLTKAALARFQAANGISPAVGYFGPLTRQFVVVH